MTDDTVAKLEKRLGRLHARLRLGVEADHEAQVFGQGINYFTSRIFPGATLLFESAYRSPGCIGAGDATPRAYKSKLTKYDPKKSLPVSTNT